MSEPVDLHRAARGLIKRWEHAPEVFFREALCVEPWEKQIEIARSVDENSRTAVRSNQKSGKSACASWIALWWSFTRPGGKVILTGPAEHQVKNILWPEVRKAVSYDRELNDARARRGLSPKPRLIEPEWLALDPRTGLRLPGERGIICVTTDEPEKIAGLSGKNLLFVVDEGSAYPTEMWAPIFGNMASGGHLLTLGNPTQQSGEFFDAFHTKREFWSRFHISAFDTPNVREGREVIPGLATRSWVDERKREWGEDSADYQIRVLGEFPKQGSDSVIALAHVEGAQKRWKHPQPQDVDTLFAGVDVARFGTDNSSVALRRGRRARIGIRKNGFDSGEVAGMTIDQVKQERRPNERVVINVDDTGGWGSGVIDRLREWAESGVGFEVRVFGVNVSEVADDEEQYHSKRDQLWFGCAEWLKTAELEPDERLASDLLAPKYAFDNRGRRQVESKEKMKKRIGRSPDDGDALCLSVYAPNVAIQDTDVPGVSGSRWDDWEEGERGFG